jgi:hypothetical protein
MEGPHAAVDRRVTLVNEHAGVDASIDLVRLERSGFWKK